MTASWQVSVVLALEGLPEPHPRALALHLGPALVCSGSDEELLTVVTRLPGRSADDAVRELSRRLAPLGLAEPHRRQGVHVRRVRRLRRRRAAPLVLGGRWDSGDEGTAGMREPRRPRPPLAPARAALALPGT